jgi:hypothetical protein
MVMTMAFLMVTSHRVLQTSEIQRAPKLMQHERLEQIQCSLDFNCLDQTRSAHLEADANFHNLLNCIIVEN